MEFHVKMKGKVKSEKDDLAKTIEYPGVTIDAAADSGEEGLYATKYKLNSSINRFKTKIGKF